MNTHALKEGEKVSKQILLRIGFMAIAKAAVGYFTGFTVLIADAISSFADLLGIFASFIGLRLSRKSADKNFEYGYYKVETFAAFLISVGIIYLGYVIALESIEILKNPSQGHHYPFAITITVLSLLLSYNFYKKLDKAATITNSLSLRANARDKKVDIVVASTVLVSIIANYRNIPYVEGVVTALISLFILKEGIFSAKESLFFLLDYWGDPQLSGRIRKILLKEKDLVRSIKKLRLRRAGTFIFGEAYIDINPFAGIVDLRSEINILKERIKKINPYIKDFSIFTNIGDIKSAKIAIPVKSGRGLQSKLAENLEKTTKYLFVTVRNGKVQKSYTKELKKSDKKPLELSEFLKKESIDILIDNKLNSLIYFNLRRTHHILVYPNFPDVDTAKKTIELLLIDI